MKYAVAKNLLETAYAMLTELNLQRAALVASCTVHGDLAEADESDRKYIEQMDKFLDRCAAAINAAEEAL